MWKIKQIDKKNYNSNFDIAELVDTSLIASYFYFGFFLSFLLLFWLPYGKLFIELITQAEMSIWLCIVETQSESHRSPYPADREEKIPGLESVLCAIE